ncbi:DUF2336 domain-containing protein [Aestuariivirga litoralis]|uniref:DUF2336 domain-containing protein n=1 Tax=Aestuariivirga litoralis TaxID=2650924 RepID=UPI0018C4971B|nr:DUF2336 domain-containing protein [Aestuariivirga litoralis]MBG1231323.1 DUF2336 domain-containing protein [Aestuariivirga litoralis]
MFASQSKVIPGLDVSIFKSVLEGPDVKARQELAQQLSQLYANPATAAFEREQIAPIFFKLAEDGETEVRAVMAEELALAAELPSDLIFAIVADEDEIALPFLLNALSISSNECAVILKVGEELRQKTLATRAGLTPETIDIIVDEGSLLAASALLDNESAELSARHYHALYTRFGGSAEMAERMLGRADLPFDIRILQARRAASRLRQMMAAKGWVPANDAREICAEAEDNAVMQVLFEIHADDRAHAMAFLAAKNLLTPAFIVRAAATGQMTIVEAALAHLSGLRGQEAAAQMYALNGNAFKSLFRRSGLPQGCFGFLRAACDVVIEIQEEGLDISSTEFGGRVLEALMTRYEAMSPADRARQIEYLGRFGEDKIRKVAKRVKVDFLRAA